MRRAALCAVFAAVGCASDFDPVSRVSGYRLLATRVDQPIAEPGETVRFETLAVTNNPGPYNVYWADCIDPQSTTPLACLADAGDLERADDHAITIPATALDGVAPDAVATISVGALQVICPGQVSIDGPASVACSELDGTGLGVEEFDVGVKRVAIRRGERNANPSIAEVRFDGEIWGPDEERVVDACDDGTTNRFDRCDVEAHDIEVIASPASFERGVDSRGVPFTEALIAQYYATEGLFEFEVKEASTPKTRFRARSGARGTTIDMWFVVRDDRGGVDWTTRRLIVRS